MASLAHKRKRDSLDHDVGHAPASGDFKEFRGSPNGQVDYEAPFLHTSHENDMPPHFADALVQHNAGDHGVHDHSMHDHSVHSHVPTNGQSASETANAALHYSMGVPQNHDESFLTHNDGHRESSAAFSLDAGAGQSNSEAYGEFAGLEQLKENAQPPQQQQQQAQPQTSVLGTTEGSPSATPSGNKPAVGTDEWHKVRRDNHKEGNKLRASIFLCGYLPDIQSNVAAAKPSMRVLMSSPRSYQAVRRTREAFFNAQFSSSLSSRRTNLKISRSGLWRSSSLNKPLPN